MSHATETSADAATKDTASRNLQLNSVVLVFGNMLTGVLGIVFWGVAARINSSEAIGSASVLISASTMLATLANLSFGPMFERFLTGFGVRAKQFVLFGFGCATVVGAVLGGLLVLLGPRDELFDSNVDMALFPVVVCIFAWFALLDQTSSALGVARWGGYKNILHSVVKLGVVVALPGATSAVIVGSWTLPSLVGVVVLGLLLWRRLTVSPITSAPVDLPPRREMLAYFGSSYGIHVVGTLAPLAIPLVVVSVLGAAQTAYFSVTWTLITAVFVLGTILVGPFIAEVSLHPDALSRLIRKFGVMIAVLTVGSSFFLGVCAPFVLGFVGAEYRAQGTSLLHYAAVIVPFWLIVVLYDSVARVQRRMTLAVSTQCLLAAIAIGGTWVLTPQYGVTGVGMAYLLAVVIGAAIVAVPLVRGFRRLATATPVREGEIT